MYKMLRLFVLLIFVPFCVIAQPNQIPASLVEQSISNKKQLKDYFKSDSIRFLNSIPALGGNALFVQYEKPDTLDFNNPFFNTDTPFNSLGSTSADYILEGLAYYKKNGNTFQRHFVNDHAFFCASCNNMKNFSIKTRGDTATIYISWGPSIATLNNHYFFVYRPESGRWQIFASAVKGSNYDGDYHAHYTVFQKSIPIFLDDIDTEGFMSPPKNEILQKLDLSYIPGHYNAFLKSLKKIPPGDFEALDKIFSRYDMDGLIGGENGNNSINSKNVVIANNIGYFLEQANVLDAAEACLDSVIVKFPKRAVAYLNLADVYRKQGNTRKAIENYKMYIRLMKAKRLERKIPDKVMRFVQSH